MSTFGILITAVALSTSGQLLLKAGMNQIGRIDELRIAALVGMLGRALVTWQIPLGLAAFGLSAMFWLVALSRVPLSTAYPVVGLSYVLILLFSVVVLGERPTAITWAGALSVVLGITLIGLGQR